jgi:hypothetical protein
VITPEELHSLTAELDDNDTLDITAHGDRGAIGDRAVLMPGVAGRVVRHDEDGDTVVRVKVRAVRHALRLLEAA